MSSLVKSQKNVFFALSDASRCGFEKNCSKNFAINLNHHLFLKFCKKKIILNKLEPKMCFFDRSRAICES
jgi:hypothetical protein